MKAVVPNCLSGSISRKVFLKIKTNLFFKSKSLIGPSVSYFAKKMSELYIFHSTGDTIHWTATKSHVYDLM